MSGYYFDKAGEPIDLLRWSDLLSDFRGYRLITEDEATGVITVWVGFDHGLLYGRPEDDGRPLIFATRLHNNNDVFSATLDEAKAVHQSAVAVAALASAREEPEA
jgi:hypothetical protein